MTISQNIFSQETISFVNNPADSMREAGNLRGAVDEFRKLIIKNTHDIYVLYNYSCALSIIGQNDSCFKYLNIISKLDTSISTLTDPDFINIKKDKRWLEYERKLLKMVEIKNKKQYRNIEYTTHLLRMKASDQVYYSELKSAEQKIGKNSTVVFALWHIKSEINENNQKELNLLIDKYGWPKISEVGNSASNSAFLIIQHSDLESQKKYLPIILNLCKVNEASWGNYALMYDRIKVNENKPQKYGSQVRYNEITKIHEFFPIENENEVEALRKEIGLETLVEYGQNWDIKFEPKKK